MDPVYYDLIAAAVLLLCLFLGYRKGFVLTLCGFLALFVALIGAYFAADALAEPVSRLLVPMLRQCLSGAFSAPEGEQAAALPALLSTLLGAAMERADSTAAGDLLQFAVSYIAERLAWLVLYVLCFAIILLLWTVLSHALDLACRLPVLSALNHWAGAVLGLIKGLVLVYAALCLLKDGFLSAEIIRQTHLLSLFYAYIPMPL